MATPRVTVVDYGMGNLFSVCRALEVNGAEAHLTRNPEEILSAERLVLPGVGAFEDGMNGLKQRGLVEPLREFVKTKRPFLGICLGMQMMLDVGEEFGTHEGLGLIPGRVQIIPNRTPQGEALKVPHIGWSALRPPAHLKTWDGTLFKGLDVGESVYFVHSFAAVPKSPENILATVDYGGNSIVAAIVSGSVYGCQFHPERSGRVGMAMVKNFIAHPVEST